MEWSVNATHTLIWGGLPYIPRGLRIASTIEDVRQAKALGFKDVVVEVPLSATPPNDVFAELDRSGMRYLVAVDSLAPALPGYAVEPQGYRVDGLMGARHVEFPIPGCRTALAIFVVKRDASVDWSKRVPVENGRFAMDVDAGNDVERVLLVYPQVIGIAQPDYWEDFDRHRDLLLAMLKRSTLGSGFRGLIDPIGRALHLETLNNRFVPSGAFYQNELRNFLQKEYRSIETAQKAWSMSSSDIDSFEQLARLVPLWSGARGVSQLWDPTTDKLYMCESARSRAWPDITEVMSQAATRRYQALCTAIRGVVDAPVVQEWAGASAPYGDDGAGLTGLGMVVAGATTSTTVEWAAKPAGAVLGWSTPGWFVATDLRLEPSAILSTVLDDLSSIGARGWFVRSKDPALLKSVAEEAQKTGDDANLSQWSPAPLFYPENATNPATSQRLPAGKWWLPSPVDGNRIDLGTKFSAYRSKSKTGQSVAIWMNSGSARVRLRMLEPKAAKFATLDGTDPQPKVVKDGVEVNLTEYPLLVTGTEEIPIPDSALIETEAQYEALFAYGAAHRRDMTQERFFFADNVHGFDRNPGGSFALLREEFWKLNKKVGRLMWIEAERPGDTNFSGPVPIPGCCEGSALTLSVPVATTSEAYYAAYDMPVSSEEDLEVWIAARIPKEQRSDVRLTVGGEILRITDEPVSAYGTGFAWYRIGTTRLKGPSTLVRLEVRPPAGADLAIDTILFYPGKFHPAGTRMPDAIMFPTGPLKKGKRR